MGHSLFNLGFSNGHHGEDLPLQATSDGAIRGDVTSRYRWSNTEAV